MGLIMWTWVRGTRHLFEKTRKNEVPLDFLVEQSRQEEAADLVPGTAVFLTSDPRARRPRCCTASSTTRCCTSRTSS